MVDVDPISGLTIGEFRDGLKLDGMVRSAKANGLWQIFIAFCEQYTSEKREAVFNNTEDQPSGNLDRGRAMGVEELLELLNTRIELALAQEKRESEADSAKDKEK